MDAIAGATGETLWSSEEEAPGFGGHPESVWDKVILWQDRVIDQRGPGLARNLLTGAPIELTHPLSGESVPWEFTKTGHHCNYAIANPHLLTFRAATAGFCDIDTASTGRLQGFRPGCRNSLIPAGGVLSAPNYAHGCICSYNLFTSLALVHVPNNDFWSYNAIPAPTDPIDRVGVNFGAEGAHRDDNTLWISYPNTIGPAMTLPIDLDNPAPRWFRMHASLIEEADLDWVGASGMEGVSRIKLHLPSNEETRKYRLQLVFAEPTPSMRPGGRTFRVRVQDNLVRDELDVARAAGGSQRIHLVEVDDVLVGDSLEVALEPLAGQPIICGLKLVAID